MKIRGTIAILFFVLSCKCLNAQDFPYYFFSNFNPMVNNPAFAASENEIRADAGMYTLWAGGYKPLNDYLISFAISPETKFRKQKRANSFKTKIGLGMVLLRERFGAFSQDIFQFDYAYHFAVSRNAYLSLGATIMVETLNIDINSLSPVNQEDPRLLTGNNSSGLFDGGFGTALHGLNYVISFSVLNLASDNFKFDDIRAAEINNYTKYNFSGEYNFEFNSYFCVAPRISIRNSVYKNYNFDPSVAVDFKHFRVGCGYRNGNSLYFFTKIPYKNFFFTYTSENPVRANHMFGNGHTFTLCWSFKPPHL